MKIRQLALFTILILLGLSLGLVLQMKVLGIIVATLGAISAVLWVDYDETAYKSWVKMYNTIVREEGSFDK